MRLLGWHNFQSLLPFVFVMALPSAWYSPSRSALWECGNRAGRMKTPDYWYRPRQFYQRVAGNWWDLPPTRLLTARIVLRATIIHWSVGNILLIWQLCSRVPPREITQFLDPSSGLREDLVSGMIKEPEHLITSCWNIDSTKRPSIPSLVHTTIVMYFLKRH